MEEMLVVCGSWMPFALRKDGVLVEMFDADR
jgi:hypothetical protein